MKTITIDTVTFYLPPPTPSETESLYNLCDANGLCPVELWERAGVFIQSGGRSGFEFWPTILEMVGIDWTPGDSITMDARWIHRQQIDGLQERLAERNRLIQGEPEPNGEHPDPTDEPSDPVAFPQESDDHRPKPKDGWNFMSVVGGKMFGYSTSSVLRWFGQQKARSQDVILMFQWCAITDVTPNTIRTQVAAGQKGKRGKPAGISGKTAKLLKTKLAECRRHADSVCE